MISRLSSLIVLAMLLIVSIVGYHMVKKQLTVEVYRRRLVALDQAYAALRTRYNQAVTRSAVTELLVHPTSVQIVIRTPEGVLETIQTPFDPNTEIYVDYALLDGRLWMRRVFDANTSPNAGVVINSALVNIDWDAASATYGKAAYRKLSPGRWVVSVTGDGSLGLAKIGPGNTIDLVASPPIQEYQPMETEVQAELETLRWSDVLKWLTPG